MMLSTMAYLSLSLAHASPLATHPELVSVTVYEETVGTREHVFLRDAAAITERLAGDLDLSNQDFNGTLSEHYDVFYSSAEGTFDPLGEYVSIECRYDGYSATGCNLNQVDFNLTDGSSLTANLAPSYVISPELDPVLQLERIMDGDLISYGTLGTTLDFPGERLRITLGLERLTGCADADGDGVCDEDDLCADTVLPDVLTSRAVVNHWAATADGTFTTSERCGGGGPLTFDMNDTAGCSCLQIAAHYGLEEAFGRFGCSVAVMLYWVEEVVP